jgi:NAD(P)-dependent dehydrogenase (short-subunit alcohol dehydrogenase family)
VQTVVLTGAAGGIGTALAAAMVARGDRVVMVDIAPDVDRVAARLTATGRGEAHGVRADVRDPAAVQGVIDQVVAEVGRLDVLVNNAGVLVSGFTDELTLAHWRRAVEVNLYGVIHGVHAAYPVMAAQGHGHIVNMSSLGGLMPVTLGVPYAATAHAVVGLSLSLRGEAAARGVRVSVVCPAVVDTPMIDAANPPDLPALPTRLPARQAFERRYRPVPAGVVAEDILTGMARDQTIILTPRSARTTWAAMQRAPLVLASQLANGTLSWARRAATTRA